MKVRFMIDDPEAIEATMKITMSVKQWEELRDQIGEKWPSSRLYSAITAVLIDARRVIYAPEKDAL